MKSNQIGFDESKGMIEREMILRVITVSDITDTKMYAAVALSRDNTALARQAPTARKKM